MPAVGIASGDFLQRSLEPGVGFDAVHHAGLDQPGDAAPCARVLAVTREQSGRPRAGQDCTESSPGAGP